jgi:chromosome segregation protein
MYLKSFTLKGFKSFADRTHMVFDPGLTVVVGPNGSGKSNISDAILWVLGEQSAKMLRGAAMEDVIFAGSSARKPVGLAEVTLVLDNSDHTLPVDFSDVAITRRMYRSGESEYLINDSPARLMDIQDILHDSGLGKDTHSIISQGKLDSILASRPEERRALIEEAAGISKHRRRKERSERKLASMDASLVRAKDVSREISRQLRPLERQVDKAKQYNDIDSRLSELTCILAVDDLRQLQGQWKGLEASGKEASAEVEMARYRLQEKQAELEKLQSMLEQKGLFVGDLGEQRRRCQSSLGRIESDMRLLEEKGHNMVDRLSDMRMTVSTVEKQRRDLIEEEDRVAAELSSVRVESKRLEDDLAVLEPAAEAARSARSEADDASTKLTTELRSAQRSADEATLAHAKLKDQISSAEVEDAMFESRIRQVDETLSVAQEALADRSDRAKRTADALGEAQAAVDSGSARTKAAETALAEARTAEDAARASFSDAKASLAALSSVVKAAEASSPLVAGLMEDDAVSSKVECRLADLIEVPENLRVIVERLLGDDLNALVVAGTPEVVTVAGAALGASSVTGRATIVSRGQVAPSHIPLCDVGRPLMDSLTIKEGAEGLVTSLLGDVRVVESIDRAVSAHATDPVFTYVTPEGATVLPDGRTYVGQADAAEAGALERKARVRSLEVELPKLEQAFAKATSTVREATAALSEARSAAAEAAGTLSRLKGEADSLASEVGRLTEQVSRATDERADLQHHREEVCAKADEARPRLAELKEKAETAGETAAELLHRIDEAGDSREAAAKADAEAASALSDARLRAATAMERGHHLEVRTAELAKRHTDLDTRRDAALEGSRSLEVLRLRVDPLHERYQALQECAVAWASRLKDRSRLAEADSSSLKQTIADARQQVTDANSALESATTAQADAKVASGRLEVQVEEAIKKITADGTHVLDDALTLPAPDDRAATEREVAKLRRQLEGIGPVNQVAMDEYDRLKERADYIEEQLRDLTAARSALTKIMSAIDRKMRRQFVTTYETVNSNFQEIFGMLFPGGQAHLEMLDPDHPDDTGIEVVAQPRGKRISKMTLMSGGEKSLTALALLFAVYRTRTVPFYVFDEVEAALDDSNLDKLLGAIEQLKETTQLIVISHQRRTMEQADVLYGVSMQADGVSHVVSQRLDHETGKVVDA